jgi:hypothetical protein
MKLIIIEVIERPKFKVQFIQLGGLIKEKNWNSGQKWLSLQTNDQNKKYNKV